MDSNLINVVSKKVNLYVNSFPCVTIFQLVKEAFEKHLTSNPIFRALHYLNAIYVLSESIVLKTSSKEHKREPFTTRKISCIEERMNKQLHLSLVKKCPEFSQEFLHFAKFFPF